MAHHVTKRALYRRRMRGGFDLLAYLRDEEPQIFPTGYFDDADPVFGFSPHYYKETIVDDLALAELGVQGDVVCHLPLWETAGTLAIDVSMYENHASFVGGPSLGQDPPPDSGLLYSVDCPGTPYIQFSSGMDWSADWTVSFWVKHRASGRAICGVDIDASTTGEINAVANSGGLRFSINDGTNTAAIINDNMIGGDDIWHKVVVRADWTANALSSWVDGEKSPDADLSTLTMPSLASEPFVLNHTNNYSNGKNRFAGPILIQSALTDAQCEAL